MLLKNFLRVRDNTTWINNKNTYFLTEILIYNYTNIFYMTQFEGRATLRPEFGIVLPTRAYVHLDGLDTAYCGNLHFAFDYFRRNIRFDEGLKNRSSKDGFLYALAVIWGKGTDRMADFFAFEKPDPWSSNPGTATWSYRNGFLVPAITCGDSLIVFGQEESYRRTTKDISEFMERPPILVGNITRSGRGLIDVAR